MAKAKTAGEKINGTTETIENAFKTGAETLKANFEKATKGYEQILGFSKDTAEAYAKSAFEARRVVFRRCRFRGRVGSCDGSARARSHARGVPAVREPCPERRRHRAVPAAPDWSRQRR